VDNDAHPGDWGGGTPTEMPREMRPALNPQTPLPVTLALEQWNAVLAVMNEAPLPNRIVAPLLIAISGQLQRAGG